MNTTMEKTFEFETDLQPKNEYFRHLCISALQSEMMGGYDYPRYMNEFYSNDYSNEMTNEEEFDKFIIVDHKLRMDEDWRIKMENVFLNRNESEYKAAYDMYEYLMVVDE